MPYHEPLQQRLTLPEVLGASWGMFGHEHVTRAAFW